MMTIFSYLGMIETAFIVVAVVAAKIASGNDKKTEKQDRILREKYQQK